MERSSQVIAADDTIDQVGGNGYGWFTTVTVPDLAIDNHQQFLAG